MSQAALQVDAEGVVLLSGELDFASAPALREQLLDAAGRGQGPLVLDFAQAPRLGLLSLVLRLHCGAVVEK